MELFIKLLIAATFPAEFCERSVNAAVAAVVVVVAIVGAAVTVVVIIVAAGIAVVVVAAEILIGTNDGVLKKTKQN